MRRQPLLLPTALVVAFATCTDAPVAPESDIAPDFGNVAASANALDAMNVQLADDGAPYRVVTAEYITALESGQMGNTIIANDVGNKQLAHDFVPNDARRSWSGPGSAVTWVNDAFDGATASGLSAGQTQGAIDNAMATWDGVTCSTLPLIKVGDAPFDIGVVQNILGFGGSGFVYADVTHGGWLPAGFFDAIAPGGSTFILGVTFTFVFTGTDVDNNGKADTAFRDIYYNDAFSWAADGSTNVDVQSVATHEAGHSLSQAHFGKVFIQKNGTLQHAPKAVMNAVYTGPQQALLGSDIGGHCSNWAQWPNN